MLLAPAVAAANASAAVEQLALLVDIRDDVTTTPAVAVVVLGGEVPNWKILLLAAVLGSEAVNKESNHGKSW